MSPFSFNKSPLNIGDEVYQINVSPEGIDVISWEITAINIDGTINIQTSRYDGNNRHTVKKNNVSSNNVHTNKSELIIIWYGVIEKHWRDIQILAEPYLVKESENL